MTRMIDAKHSNAMNIPPGTPKVAGYVTGTSDIQWTPEDWAMFNGSGRVRIDQEGDPALHAAIVDCEALAATPTVAAECVRARLAAGFTDAGIYASENTVPAAAGALRAAQVNLGLVALWLANWNLDEAEAQRLLGTKMDGLTIAAVQWASPTSNPRTLVPGGNGATLETAGVDLSVTLPGWYAPPLAPGSWQGNLLDGLRTIKTDLGDAIAIVEAHL